MQEPGPREAAPVAAITLQKWKNKYFEPTAVRYLCLEYFMQNPEAKTD